MKTQQGESWELKLKPDYGIIVIKKNVVNL
jgi:hypothetical protein